MTPIGRQRRSLYGCATVNAIVPQDDLTAVSAANDEILMERREGGGHNSRLTVENELRL